MHRAHGELGVVSKSTRVLLCCMFAMNGEARSGPVKHAAPEHGSASVHVRFPLYTTRLLTRQAVYTTNTHDSRFVIHDFSRKSKAFTNLSQGKPFTASARNAAPCARENDRRAASRIRADKLERARAKQQQGQNTKGPTLFSNRLCTLTPTLFTSASSRCCIPSSHLQTSHSAPDRLCSFLLRKHISGSEIDPHRKGCRPLPRYPPPLWEGLARKIEVLIRSDSILSPLVDPGTPAA